MERFISDLESVHGLTLPLGRAPGLRFMVRDLEGPFVECSASLHLGAPSSLGRCLESNSRPSCYAASLSLPPHSWPQSHKWDRLRTLHIPAIFFLLSEAAAVFANTLYLLLGFRRGTSGCLTYWHKPARLAPRQPRQPQQPQPPPVIFVHGLGLGLVPYVPFVVQLYRSFGGERPVVLVELRHISLRFIARMPTMEAIATSLRDIAALHSGRGSGSGSGSGPIGGGALFVGHSYGTACLARLEKLYPGTLSAAVLIDPVCFLVLRPELLHNFIYRSPGEGLTGAAKVNDAVRTTLCARELQSAAALCRYFDWYALTLWPDQLPGKGASLVALAAQDELVNASAVRRHLEAAGVPVLWHPTQRHAGFLVDLGWQADILAEVVRLEKRRLDPDLIQQLASGRRDVLEVPTSNGGGGGSAGWTRGGDKSA